MACDTKPIRAKQTLQERAEEVRSAVASLDKLLLRRQARAVVGPQGAVTFTGSAWEAVKSSVSDACAYRRIMATGSVLAKAEIARAEQMAGRAVDKRVLTQGIHSHDGGQTWNSKG